jgi:hypothetical protein
MLSIRVDAHGSMTIVFRDGVGHENSRIVTTPTDPAQTLATIAWIAGSLARAETEDVLAQISPAVSPPPAAPQFVALPSIPVRISDNVASQPSERATRHWLTPLRWLSTSIGLTALTESVVYLATSHGVAAFGPGAATVDWRPLDGFSGAMLIGGTVTTALAVVLWAIPHEYVIHRDASAPPIAFNLSPTSASLTVHF